MNRILFASKRDHALDDLANIDMFRSCSREELQRIAARTTNLLVAENTVLCRKGSTGREAFIVVEGYAEVRQDGVCIATIGPSGFFGEMSLLDRSPRVADVVAVTPMHLLVMSTTDLNVALRESPTFARKMLEELGDRLRRAQHDGDPTD